MLAYFGVVLGIMAIIFSFWFLVEIEELRLAHERRIEELERLMLEQARDPHGWWL